MKKIDDSFKISILTPSYNTGPYLERAIQSVQAQSYTNWEHIIIDGGSTDDTPSILQKYPHLKWVSEKDKGQSDAMNKAFERATGDIIAYLNADDAFAAGAFETVAAHFSKNPTCQFVVGHLKTIHEKGAENVYIPSTNLLDILNLEPLTFPRNPVSYFYKKEVQKTIGAFPVANHYTMDYWFLLRAYWHFDIQLIPKVLGTFYYHQDNKTNDLDRGGHSV